MPAKSPEQQRLMEAAAHTPGGYGGVPQSVGKEFVKADSGDEVCAGILLRASGCNELDIAKAIRAGELTSPQQYENIWLFDVRVTGTGTSYRQALDEYVYRPPEDFLSDEFVERCYGLPLIFEHPEKGILNTDEYRDRAIGTVILPYVKGDEVWGIAKVFDADAAELMKTTHASTSPAVVFRDAGSTETIELSDGKTVLIEGKPSYLDHLAICEAGVWDKGGTPNGVNNHEDTTMANEEEKVPAWADALNKRFDEVCSRMDAIEEKGGEKFDARKDEDKEKKDSEDEKKDARKDSEKEEKEEKKDARKDADEEKGEKEKEEKKDADEEKKERKEEKADSSLAAQNAEMRMSIEAMSRRLDALNKPLSAEDRNGLSLAQQRAENIGRLFGDSVPPPLHGEKPIDYRKRLAVKFQKYSNAMKAERLDSLTGASFDLVEDRIYADAQAASAMPESYAAGRLIPHVTTDSSGRTITSFSGDIGTFMSPFSSPGVIATINRPSKGVH